MVGNGKISPPFKVKGRSTSSKKIGIISDMHCGGIKSLTPEPHNAYQRSLYEHWMYNRDTIGYCDLLLENGEPIQGENKKQLGAENDTSDINLQIEFAVDMTKHWRYKCMLVTQGSDYHTRHNWTNFEETYAKILRADRYTDDNNLSGMFVNIYLHDILFNCCHHIRVSNVNTYITTPLQAEMGGMHYNRGKYFNEDEHVDVFVRSHSHRNLYIEHPSERGVVLGCWQYPNIYVLRRGMGGVFPTFGAVAFTVESNGQIIYEKHMMRNDKIVKQPAYRLK